MKKINAVALNIVFFLQVLLIFLLLVEDFIALPVWLQVAGRLHPAVLHLPIGLLTFLFVLLFARREFKKKAFRKFVSFVLILTSFTASITALFGFFLARQGDYGPDSLSRHKISGTLLSLLCFALIYLFERMREPGINAFYGGVVVTLGTLLFAGHTGGTLTHGENFVLGPLAKPGAEGSADGTAFQAVVYPIFEKKCSSCHNESKAKGKLVMTNVAAFQKGGKKGKEWVEGNPAESRMIRYIHLPLEDDDHMPPDGKPQLTKTEVAVLERWIKDGADFEAKFSDLRDGDSLKILAAELPGYGTVQAETKNYAFEAAHESVVEKLNTPFRSVFPLYQNSPALQADFFLRQYYQSRALEDLKEVKEQLVVLNLSKMPVTDADLATVSQFKNLEKVNLNFTRVTGAGLTALQDLKHLTSVSVAGTEVDATSLKPVLTLPGLKELFVWNTKVTAEDQARLSKEYPEVRIATTEFTDERILRLSKPQLSNEGIIGKNEKVTLRHSMPGVEIRYTLDGSNPDSVTAKKYAEPFLLTASVKLKAIACKNGWYCSDIFETTCFLEGEKPSRAVLLTRPDKEYPGEGSKSLTDGRKGFTDVFREPSWLGYRDQPLAAEFEFGGKPIRSIVVSYGKALYSSIFPPQEVEVWLGKSGADLKLVKRLTVEMPKYYEPQPRLEALVIPLDNLSGEFCKIVAKPVAKLPQWHSSKGKKGWIFVDEIFFY